MEQAHSMSHNCQLPLFLWTKAVATTMYLINKSPIRANHSMTPEAKYRGTKLNIFNLCIFGCLAFIHILKKQHNKFNSKIWRCLYLKIDKEIKGYKLYDHTCQKVIINRDVIFDESKIGF